MATNAHNQLIERVAEFDREAAKWLKDEAPKMCCVQCGDLSRTMNWRDTPQGWEYWNSINTQIEFQLNAEAQIMSARQNESEG